MNNNIRFGCHKCGQRLACETPSLGTQIQCPACKQTILVPTVEIVRSYELLEIGLRAPMDEIRRVHHEQMKAWHPDGFTSEIEKKQALDKVKELNGAFETITAYLTGTYQEKARAKPREAPRREPESKPRPPAEPRAENKPAPASARPGPAPMPATVKRFPVGLILVGVGVMAVIAVVVWLIIGMMQRQGPTLTDDSTGTQWIQAKEFAKRSYCHSILVEMEQNGTLRKYGVRVNEQFFYDGLQAMARQKNPDDLNSKLLDLSTKMVLAERVPNARDGQ